MSELKLSEQFSLHFQQLRSACNDSPQTLINFFREKPDIEAHATKVKQLADTIDRVSTFRKLHPQVAPKFIEDWKLYLSNWKAQVEFVEMFAFLSLNLFDEADFKPPTFERFKSNQNHIFARDAPDPALDDSFDPVRHDGGNAVTQMVDLVSNQASEHRENAQSDYDEFIANTYTIGVEAIDHLENVVGIDIARVYDRWNLMPSIFVPQHVSDHYGLTDDWSLFGLFNQAVRAYVAGAPAASIALCRSLLETVLKNHYLAPYLDPKSGNERRKLQDMKLNRVIEIAVERYKFLNKEQLDDHRKYSNRVLHDFSSGKTLSKDDEIDLLKFFRDLKNYIEQAPSKGQ